MTTSHRILVLNGPNLNLLGTRQPHLYGAETLADVEARCRAVAEETGARIDFHQSNHEGVLIDLVQTARTDFDAVVINPGGYTHTSIALMDALLAIDTPVVEVHVTNVHRREEFRRHSYVSLAATAVFAGAGLDGYEFAIRHLVRLLAAAPRTSTPDAPRAARPSAPASAAPGVASITRLAR
ncbi:type II 3-dehydroquinate dehydratase [Agromyces seonyuensis]|uniref:3-dehydroquinate dehydratase n=1 Tax=Agromyces seonyuensis TaxID=2662446 RepID=A0A6I4NXH9_9MICO|nr:type II 3-dehydroquinate dehydratase [Agromyces seonyuensis]MWB97225.1 type II 3-dehydroquinate dehydratase [Agromyces seonyuensis]